MANLHKKKMQTGNPESQGELDCIGFRSNPSRHESLPGSGLSFPGSSKGNWRRGREVMFRPRRNPGFFG